MEKLIKLLIEKGLTLSCCESLTGGLFASSIVNISGASATFVGGYVTYQDRCKEILLDGKEILQSVGAVSQEMSIRMAITVKEDLHSDVSISFTGNAGPLPSEEKPVGLVYCCIVYQDRIYTFEDHYHGTREEIRNQCVKDGVKRIFEIVQSNF